MSQATELDYEFLIVISLVIYFSFRVCYWTLRFTFPRRPNNFGTLNKITI